MKNNHQNFIKTFRYIFITILAICSFNVFAQDSSYVPKDSTGNIVILKDSRIDLIGKKMAEYNSRQAFKNSRVGPGYRLMVISTSNREEAIKVRTYLLQQYPDQQVYMTFVNPFIKLKFGDFADKKEAEDVRKQLAKSPLITGNIYILPEKVNLKGDKSLLE